MKEKKRIIYSVENLHLYEEYGISIPLLDDRVLKTIQELENDYKLALSSWKPASTDDLLLAHSNEFVERASADPDSVVIDTYELIDEAGNYNRYDPAKKRKPLSDFVDKAKAHIGGTYYAALVALSEKFAYHLGGGMHHAMSDRPGGFCMFNDLVITAKKLQREKKINKVIIIDLDCHKGDGTAEITKDDDSIFSVSIHMANGWPLDDASKNSEKYKLSSIPSDMDIPVKQGDDYLMLLKEGIDSIDLTEFDLALVVHGADVYEHDVLESAKLIQLTKEQVLERDLYVFNKLKEVNLPQSWCLGGGYGPKTYEVYVQFLKKIQSL